MTLRLMFSSLALGIFMAASAVAASAIPKPLALQVRQLSGLLTDGHAQLYAQATERQVIALNHDEDINLVWFTLEGFGGGNNYSRYLAAFSCENNTDRGVHCRLLDLQLFGGDYNDLKKITAKKLAEDTSTHALTIVVEGMQMGKAFNDTIPKKVTRYFLLKGDRLYEEKSADGPVIISD